MDLRKFTAQLQVKQYFFFEHDFPLYNRLKRSC